MRTQEQDNIDGDVDMTVVDTDHSQSRSAGSAVSLSGSSCRRPATSSFDSDDDQEGGIADDAGEKSERINLTGKPMRTSIPGIGHYSSWRSKDEAKVSVNLVFHVA